MRLIDADVLKQHIDKLPALPDGNFAGNHSALKALINMQPTIEPSANCSGIPNNSDTISRQQAIDTLRAMQTYKLFAGDDMILVDKAQVQAELMMLPPVQPEHKTGSWIPVTNGRGGHQCDRCGSYAPSYQSGAEWLSNFCPECNADMRGEQNDNR